MKLLKNLLQKLQNLLVLYNFGNNLGEAGLTFKTFFRHHSILDLKGISLNKLLYHKKK